VLSSDQAIGRIARQYQALSTSTKETGQLSFGARLELLQKSGLLTHPRKLAQTRMFVSIKTALPGVKAINVFAPESRRRISQPAV